MLMAHLLRLAIAALLACLATLAHASFPAPPGGFGPTASCNPSAFPAQVLPGVTSAWECRATPNPDLQDCGWLYSPSNYFAGACGIQREPPKCPSGASSSTVNGQTMCTCNAGLVETGSQCLPPGDLCEAGREKNAQGECKCKAGTKEPVGGVGACVIDDKAVCFTLSAVGTLPGGALVEGQRLTGNVANGASFCLPMTNTSSPNIGCKVTFNRDAVLDYGGGNVITEGTYSMAGNSNTVDQSCSVSGGESPKPPKEKCPNGYSGTVNGVETCVNKVPDSGIGGDTSENTTDDGTNTTTTRTNNNTTCKDGVCTTVTTTTTTVTNNGTGASTTTTTTNTSTKPQGGFCQENPKSKLCDDGGDDGSAFTGSCSAGFQCEGDAIQCAIAREQHKTNCKLLDVENPDPAYKAAIDGTDDKSADKLRQDAQQVSVESFDQSGLGWSRSCPADPSFDVAGKSFSIPFSKVCGVLGVLSAAALGLTLLSCLMWVVGKKD